MSTSGEADNASIRTHLDLSNDLESVVVELAIAKERVRWVSK